MQAGATRFGIQSVPRCHVVALAAKQTPDRPKLQHPVLHRSCICDALQMPCDDAIQLKLHSRRTLFYLLFLPLCFIPAFVIQPKTRFGALSIGDARPAAFLVTATRYGHSTRGADFIWTGSPVSMRSAGLKLGTVACNQKTRQAENQPSALYHQTTIQSEFTLSAVS